MKAHAKLCMALAMLGLGLCVGCVTDTERAARHAAVKREAAEVIRLAYEVGGRDLVADYIDKLVADGKVTEEQAEVLHRAAQAVYERTVTKLEGGTNTATTVTGGANASVTNAGECADCVVR